MFVYILHHKPNSLTDVKSKQTFLVSNMKKRGFFFQKQLKPMGYYSGEKSTDQKIHLFFIFETKNVCLLFTSVSDFGLWCKM